MKKVLPPIYFLAAVVLAVLLHYAIPMQQFLVFPWTLLGFIPVVGGVVMILCAGWLFKRHNTTVKPFAHSTALVTDGVYRLTRNPMYLGMVTILSGVVLLLGSATPLVVAGALPVLLDRIHIAAEEQKLEHTFGEPFREYCKRVRRWV